VTEGARASRSAVLLLAILTTATACRRAREQPIARLLEGKGVVEAERQGHWGPASPGAELRAGEALRTGEASWARLRFTSGKTLRLGERALVRLVVGSRPAAPALAVDLGEADVEGEGALAVSTARGTARLAPGSRVRVRVTSDEARFEVLIGRAVLGEGQAAVAIEAGEGVALVLGRAQLERYRVRVGSAVMEEAAAPPPPARPPGAETPEAPATTPAPEAASARHAQPEAPDSEETPADVSVPAGESAVIHGRRSPVLVRVSLAGACESGKVEVVATRRSGGREQKRASGRNGAVVALGTGGFRYKLLCGRAEKATGTLAVRTDPGTTHVPRSPPVNTLEADGRRYTILYQNRLPALALAWPAAPPSARFTLHVQSGQKERVFEAPVARRRLASGALGEGEHLWWFTTADGVASAQTSLAIRFDNPAVTAQIQAPAEGWRPRAGQDVEVAGIAIEGSTVAVGSARLAVDAQGRFRGRVPRPGAGERAIAIRLEHPRTGVHYYIRRLAASRPSRRR
jgi:hypothetical protein